MSVSIPCLHLPKLTLRQLYSYQVRNMAYSARQIGEKNTLDYKSYIQVNHKPVSAFHDVPLVPHEDKGEGKISSNVFNMVIEVPRWTNAKLEISKETPLNPIIQDTKKDKLRYVANVFPYHGYIHNYGALPQTWEDPNYKHNGTNSYGDNDPLDVCEIGHTIGFPGEVRKVKVLGCLAMIDEGATDWKVIAISVDDPLAAKVDDIQDVDKHMPGLLDATRSWFKNYKVPDGKPENVFAYKGQFQDKQFALDIVKECHESWKDLISGKAPAGSIRLDNTTLKGTPGYNEDLAKTVPDGKELTERTGGPIIDEISYVSKL